MREVRLRFSKEGRAKYISHLDVNRAIGRALKRAEIPLWYTEGYNPHPYMSFSLPLSLGVESLCESVDIRLTGAMENCEIKERMNAVLPVGIRIMDVYDCFRDCSEIAYSDYVYYFEFKDNESALAAIQKVLEADTIPALKKKKAGRKRILQETDIKQYIDRYSISIREQNIVLNIRLAAGPARNLNPTLLFDTIIRLIEMDFEWKSIRRIRLLDCNLQEFM